MYTIKVGFHTIGDALGYEVLDPDGKAIAAFILYEDALEYARWKTNLEAPAVNHHNGAIDGDF